MALELAMFLNVPTSQPYSCQEDPQSFKVHRKAQFAAWSVPTLESYYYDLQAAKDAGRNLLAIKYARMDNLVPCVNFSPRIASIVHLAITGQQRFIDAYPRLMQGGRSLCTSTDDNGLTSFETYLRCELETYSETTLGLLLADIRGLEQSGSSLSEAVYRCLAQQWGFDSLEALEASLQQKDPATGGL
jgi:hypothetical protein